MLTILFTADAQLQTFLDDFNPFSKIHLCKRLKTNREKHPCISIVIINSNTFGLLRDLPAGFGCHSFDLLSHL